MLTYSLNTGSTFFHTIVYIFHILIHMTNVFFNSHLTFTKCLVNIFQILDQHFSNAWLTIIFQKFFVKCVLLCAFLECLEVFPSKNGMFGAINKNKARNNIEKYKAVVARKLGQPIQARLPYLSICTSCLTYCILVLQSTWQKETFYQDLYFLICNFIYASSNR